MTGQLDYCSAGHPAALLLRGMDQLELFPTVDQCLALFLRARLNAGV